MLTGAVGLAPLPGAGPLGSEGMAGPGSLWDLRAVFTCSQGPGKKAECSGPPLNLAFNPQASVHTGFAGPGLPGKLGLSPLGSSLKTLSHLFSKAALVSKDRKHAYFRRLARTAVWGSRGLAFLSIHNRVVLYRNQILSASVSSHLRCL